MSYNPEEQYRCTIIRGKSISKMDDYLSIYAQILNEICPLPSKEFDLAFDKKLSHYIKDDEKTIKNHRTENAGQILGMYYEKDNIIYCSERTIKFIGDNDQPAFFKSVCFKFQQPNGSQKINTIVGKVNHKVNFKPNHFVLSLLKLAANKKMVLLKDEVGYYVLNSLQVLQGKIKVEEVLKEIIANRAKKIHNRVETPGQNAAYDRQHINEQFDYLELANLIRKDAKSIWINPSEMLTINLFEKDLSKPLAIDYRRYDFSKKGVGKTITLEWQEYFGEISEEEKRTFTTSVSSLIISAPDKVAPAFPVISTVELGDDGEDFVIRYEREIVKAFQPRLVNKINHLGKTKGLGYDITSIEANRNKKQPEFTRYIEVKATKRVHPPDFTNIKDRIYLTRNEWVAAEQNSTHYYIYRVYFTSKGTFINIIKDPVQKNNDGILYAVPLEYSLEFDESAVDEKL